MSSAPTELLYTTLASPIGELLLLGDGRALHGLWMLEGRRPVHIAREWSRSSRAFKEVARELRQYFDGERRRFDVALAMHGSPFQRRVWRELLAIPYGETVSYGALARVIGRPGAARAVGTANASNPIAVIVPCHRVVGAGGRLTGYVGGLQRKRMLLELEAGTTAHLPLGR